MKKEHKPFSEKLLKTADKRLYFLGGESIYHVYEFVFTHSPVFELKSERHIQRER